MILDPQHRTEMNNHCVLHYNKWQNNIIHYSTLTIIHCIFTVYLCLMNTFDVSNCYRHTDHIKPTDPPILFVLLQLVEWVKHHLVHAASASLPKKYPRQKLSPSPRLTANVRRRRLCTSLLHSNTKCLVLCYHNTLTHTDSTLTFYDFSAGSILAEDTSVWARL